MPLILVIAIVIIAIIILVFALLPVIAKSIVNKALQKMEGYTGKTDRVHVNPFKSKISLHNINVYKEGDLNFDTPFVSIPNVSISFKWARLFNKTLDLKIILDKPQVVYIAEHTSAKDDEDRLEELPSLKTAIEKKIPFKITLEVRDGTIHYVSSQPALDVIATELYLSIHDFSNRLSLSKSCSIVSTWSLYGGNAKMKATLLPLESTLTADLNLELKAINLVQLNNLIRQFGMVDISKGTLDFYAEVAVANNSFKGYVKPLLKNLEFVSAADRNDTVVQKIWERLAAGFYNVLENTRNQQIATTIPIEGRFDDPHVRVGAAILGILRNAFVKALTPTLDDVINFKSIWKIARSETAGMVKAFFQ